MRTREELEDAIETYRRAIGNSEAMIEVFRCQIEDLENEIINEQDKIEKMENYLDSLHTALDDFNQNTQ